VIVDKWGGKVPESYKDLLSLPGVGPKIANLMRSVAFGKEDAGIVVDTHVHRVARLLQWVPTGAAVSSTTQTAAVASSTAPLFARGFQRAVGNGSDGPEKTREALESWVPYAQRAQFALDVVGFGQITRQQGWTTPFLQYVWEENPDIDDAQVNANVRIAEDIVRKIEGKSADADDQTPKSKVDDTSIIVVEAAAEDDAAKPDIDEKFACRVCTFANNFQSTKCEMCGTSFHVLNEGAASISEIETTLSSEMIETPDIQEAEPVSSSVTPSTIASAPQVLSSDVSTRQESESSMPSAEESSGSHYFNSGSSETDLSGGALEQESNETGRPGSSRCCAETSISNSRRGKFGKLSLKKSC